jgi:polyisoprenoid-binding protein YceI
VKIKTLFMLSPILLGIGSLPAAAAPAPISANPAEVKAGTYVLDPNHGKITWSLNHLGFSTYTGQFSHVTGNLVLDPEHIARTTLEATVDIGSIGTLNPTLDQELKGDKFFNEAANPTAVFKSTKVQRTGSKTADVTGDLTLMGVTQPVTLSVVFNQGGTNPISNTYEIGFEGHTKIKRSEFGLKAFVPYVGDEVTLDLEGEFDLKL